MLRSCEREPGVSGALPLSYEGGTRTRDLQDQITGSLRPAARIRPAGVEPAASAVAGRCSSAELRAFVACVFSVVGAALPPFDPGSVSYVEGCWSLVGPPVAARPFSRGRGLVVMSGASLIVRVPSVAGKEKGGPWGRPRSVVVCRGRAQAVAGLRARWRGNCRSFELCLVMAMSNRRASCGSSQGPSRACGTESGPESGALPLGFESAQSASARATWPGSAATNRVRGYLAATGATAVSRSRPTPTTRR